MKSIEKLRTKVSDASLRYVILAAGSLGAYAVRDIQGTRAILPEPFDFFDHSGNVGLSFNMGYFAGLAAGNYVTNISDIKNSESSSVGRVRSVMAGAGFVAGLALNSLTETKLGVRLVGWENTTPDMIDLAYGVGSATLAASLVPKVEQVVDD